ncbi:DsbA family protein [Frigidibacter oleivorans]|uniref:DsbA family protein n=1 Tax=Frigidibacter oleivorans TaxID=2487129 RepID=UPI000F8CA0FA|nr:DsbA family protein [Frigidibacter oleivorans]
MKRRNFLIAASGGLVAGGALLGLDGGSRTGAAFAQDATAEIRPDFVQGSADAPVTLMEYASFTCPHCANFHATVYPQLKENYIDTGKVKFILREVYFDKYGLWAGMVAQCAGEARYYGVADMLFDRQREWLGDGQDATIGANLRRIGATAGLSPEQLDACLNDQAMAQSMVATYQKNATDDGVNATPTLFINGTKHQNMSYEELSTLLDAELAG